MRLTRRALLRDLGVLEARLRTAEDEVVSLRQRVANLLNQKAPSYDERIRLARRAEDAEAAAEAAEEEAKHWRLTHDGLARRLEQLADRFPDFPRSIP